VKIAGKELAACQFAGVVFALFFYRVPHHQDQGKAMKTFSAKPGEVKQDWLLIDASGQTLGRMASTIAHRLRGKHKPEYTPHVDTGDYVIVINADKVRVTGKKAAQKQYYRHSGYPGGITSMSFEKLQAHDPCRVIRLAVRGMLPHNILGRAMMRKLKIYAGSEHPHTAQSPLPLEL